MLPFSLFARLTSNFAFRHFTYCRITGVMGGDLRTVPSFLINFRLPVRFFLIVQQNLGFYQKLGLDMLTCNSTNIPSFLCPLF